MVILPEARIPADSGQRTLTIHPDKKTGVTPEWTLRKKVITFGVSLSQRIRDIPNDRFDEVTYMESMNMTALADQLELDHPADEPIYQLSDSFRYLSTNFDPKHLYPSDYLTRNSKNDKEQLYDKLAGYRMTALFESPEIQRTSPLYACRGLLDSSSV